MNMTGRVLWLFAEMQLALSTPEPNPRATSCRSWSPSRNHSESRTRLRSLTDRGTCRGRHRGRTDDPVGLVAPPHRLTMRRSSRHPTSTRPPTELGRIDPVLGHRCRRGQHDPISILGFEAVGKQRPLEHRRQRAARQHRNQRQCGPARRHDFRWRHRAGRPLGSRQRRHDLERLAGISFHRLGSGPGYGEGLIRAPSNRRRESFPKQKWPARCGPFYRNRLVRTLVAGIGFEPMTFRL